MGAAQGVEVRLRAGGIGGGDARAALGAHGGVWRGRRARAAQGALRWMRIGKNGARRRRLGVQASGGVSVGERRRVVAARRRLRSGGGGGVGRNREGRRNRRPAQDTYMTGGTRDFL